MFKFMKHKVGRRSGEVSVGHPHLVSKNYLKCAKHDVFDLTTNLYNKMWPKGEGGAEVRDSNDFCYD